MLGLRYYRATKSRARGAAFCSYKYLGGRQDTIRNEGTQMWFASQSPYRQNAHIKPNATANVSDAQTSNASVFFPKLIWRLSFPVRWFHESRFRAMVLEIRNLHLRIAALRRVPSPHLGTTLYSASRDRSMGNFVEESKYQRACREHIQELRENHRWVCLLDLEIAAQMHRRGALWARDTFGNGIGNTERPSSS